MSGRSNVNSDLLYLTSPPPDFVPFEKSAIYQGIHQRIEEQVRHRPNQTALKDPNSAYTYRELNSRANCIASEIVNWLGTTHCQVGILQRNTTDLIVSILGVLKAGKAYVPLDPNFPKYRLQAMAEDAQVKGILAEGIHLKLARELATSQIPVFDLRQVKFSPDAPNLDLPCDPLQRAYILFTSGSTGRPKGIEFVHRNLLHTTMCLTNKLCWAPSDRVTWLHSASFAASVVDIYCCLTNGGTLYPWDVKELGLHGLADWLNREKITTFQWIPSAFRQLLRTVKEDYQFDSIRLVVMASEPLSIREFKLFQKHFRGGSFLVNQVGTSESYNYCLYLMNHDSQIEGASIPGGYPVSEDREVLILDENRQPVPPGETGEIAIRSNYMAVGYWGDETLTAQKFIRLTPDDPPTYLTGDLGYIEPSGRLIHLGRKDHQVKIRGYRVELSEIESALSKAPGVADAVTRVVKTPSGEDAIVAYVIQRYRGSFDQTAVEAHLRSYLPDYMIPQRYLTLESFPTLPTGKVDRTRFPNPFVEQDDAIQSSREPARLDIEHQVVSICREVLGRSDVYSNTDLVSCGGTSLLTAVLLCRIHDTFGVLLMPSQLPQPLTPANLAALLHSKALPRSCSNFRSNTQHPPDKTSAEFTDRFKPRQDVASTKNLLIISAGKFGRETYAWSAQCIAAGAPLRIKGFLDDRPQVLTGYQYESPVLGSPDDYNIEEEDVFVGAIGDPAAKQRYYTPIASKGGVFVNIIHPLANLGCNVRLGSGIVLAPFVSATCDVTIGDHVSVGAFSNLGHDVVVGDWCQISSHCSINGNVRLGNAVFVGSHACIIPGVRIGDRAYIGAGSVVLTDVAPGIKVFGNPARPIGTVD